MIAAWFNGFFKSSIFWHPHVLRDGLQYDKVLFHIFFLEYTIHIGDWHNLPFHQEAPICGIDLDLICNRLLLVEAPYSTEFP